MISSPRIPHQLKRMIEQKKTILTHTLLYAKFLLGAIKKADSFLAIRLFVVCPLVILAQPNTSAYNMEIYSNKKTLLAIMQSEYLSEMVIRRLFKKFF